MITRRPLALLALALSTVAAGCAHPAGSVLELEYLAANGPLTSPYSPAVRIGHVLFLSAQVGLDASGKLVSGGIQAEARQALNNIAAELKRDGSGMDHVAKCTVYLTNINDFAAMNEIYASYFTLHKPTRATIGVASLPYNAVIEVDCIAAMD